MGRRSLRLDLRLAHFVLESAIHKLLHQLLHCPLRALTGLGSGLLALAILFEE